MNKRNISIELIRVVAMFMIIADHIFAYVDIPMKTIIVQIANSGTLIFFFISGYLYGNKDISNWKDWFVKRLLRICIPMWIFVAVDLVIEYAIWNTFDIKYIFIYLFNLQGIFGVTSGGSPLWFLTLLMVCYIITPLIQFIHRSKFRKYIEVALLGISIISQIILAYVTDIGMVGNHTISWCIGAIMIYLIGYFAGKSVLKDNLTLRKMICTTVVTAIVGIAVILFNNCIDGTVLYDRVVFFYGMVFIDYWLCTVLYWLGNKINNRIGLKVLNHLSIMSYEIYIVHGLVILSITLPLAVTYGIAAYTVITLFLSYVCACVLHNVCNLVYKAIKYK